MKLFSCITTALLPLLFRATAYVAAKNLAKKLLWDYASSDLNIAACWSCKKVITFVFFKIAQRC